MRIVHIEDFFHPNAGYQVNILSKYQAKFGHEVYIVTSELEMIPSELKDFFGGNGIEEFDNEFYENYNVKIIRIPLYTYISGRSIYKSKIFRTVDNLNPDIVYVHGNDTYMGIRYILKAKKLTYPIISDNHMARIASRNRLRYIFYSFYSNFITPSIIKNSIQIIKMSNDDFVYKYFHIPNELTPIVGFGSDLMFFHPAPQKRIAMRNHLGIDQESLVIIYAGKLDESKGARFYAEAIKDKFISDRKLVFLIVGNLVGEYGETISRLYKMSENDIILEPTQKYADLAHYYQMADIAVFPKQFSLSFFDVQACGLPVLLEDNDINLQRTVYDNGLVFKSGDMEDIRNKIYEYINMPASKFENMRMNAIKFIKDNYDYEVICQKYMEIIHKQCEKYNEMKCLKLKR
jgi:glycosyltransferase involved in cell wall biosynthesis